MKSELVTKNPSRFFSFGCSFTNYHWTTWPEIIAEDLDVAFYNLGKCGAGNEFIFNRLMQVDMHHQLNENDLVIICWTNVCREDRFANGSWIIPGNIFTQKEYSDEFVKKYYSDVESISLHDFAYIQACKTVLQHKKCQWHFLQMLDIDSFTNQWSSDSKYKTKHLVHNVMQDMQSSFYEVLWDNDIENKVKKELKTKRYIDGHPSPKEHLQYLQHVFDHRWKESTVSKIDELEKEWQDQLIHITSYSELLSLNLTHLRSSLKNEIF